LTAFMRGHPVLVESQSCTFSSTASAVSAIPGQISGEKDSNLHFDFGLGVSHQFQREPKLASNLLSEKLMRAT
jgi:hypothetical protein